MYETYRIMSSKLPRHLQDMELEELCVLYSKYDAVVKEWVDLRQAWKDYEKRQQLQTVVNELTQNLDLSLDKTKKKLVDKLEKMINKIKVKEPPQKELPPRDTIAKEIKLRDDVYRTMYCKLYPMMLSVQKNYTTLSNAQRVEVTMMILISTLRCYTQNKKIKTKFSTYYCTNLKNGMMTQINSLKCNKRSVWLNMLEDEQQTGFILGSQANKDEEITSDYFLNNLDQCTELSTIEKEYIKCVLKGYKKEKEIAKQLNLQEKVNTYAKSVGLATKPMTAKETTQYLKKVQASINNKFTKMDRDLFFV